MKKKPTRITGRLNTTRLIEVVAADLDTTPAAVRDTVMATFDAIGRSVASGHDVAITNFLTFRSLRVKRRACRNPQTGETVTVPSHRVVRPRVSDHLAAGVRSGDRKFTIRKAPKGSKTPAVPTTAPTE